MKKIRSHLTYANVMSSLAVFLLLGGATAIAAKKQTQKIGTAQIKASAITTGKIKNGAVNESKLAASAVTNAKLADGAVSGSKLADGAVSGSKLAADSVTGDKVVESTLSEVPSANSANPTAFAHVFAGGTVVDAANSKGITSPNIGHSLAGTYCVTVPSFTPRGAQVTAQASGLSPTSANVSVGGGSSCPASAVQVLTFNGGVLTDIAFYVELYR